jgi:hypothetical protein
MPARFAPVFAVSRRFLLVSTIAVLGLTAGSFQTNHLVAGGEPGASDDKQLDPQEAAAKESRSRNNLKQLMLAMYNYHDIHAHFPPAVVIGPDGKTPHSWRVELLPILDEGALYKQYRLNEPWDSPHNKLLLRQIPDVFRTPFDDSKSTNSGYYALVGPGTVFEGTKGIRVRDITDGTSFTFALVEAKRDIPWTKPADIPFAPDKPVPQFGGFVKGHFTAATADGACRVLRFADFKGDDLKWLIMRNDGHPMQLP